MCITRDGKDAWDPEHMQDTKPKSVVSTASKQDSPEVHFDVLLLLYIVSLNVMVDLHSWKTPTSPSKLLLATESSPTIAKELSNIRFAKLTASVPICDNSCTKQFGFFMLCNIMSFSESWWIHQFHFYITQPGVKAIPHNFKLNVFITVNKFSSNSCQWQLTSNWMFFPPSQTFLL